MSNITDFISATIEEKPVAAQKAFAAAMEPKINAAIAAKYDEVATKIFNNTLESETDLEPEMEDN